MQFFAVSHLRKISIKEQLGPALHFHSKGSRPTFYNSLTPLVIPAILIAHYSLHNGLAGQLYYSTHGVQAKFKAPQWIYRERAQRAEHIYCDASACTSCITFKVTIMPFPCLIIILFTWYRLELLATSSQRFFADLLHLTIFICACVCYGPAQILPTTSQKPPSNTMEEVGAESLQCISVRFQNWKTVWEQMNSFMPQRYSASFLVYFAEPNFPS